MKTRIEVETREEGAQIKTALADPEVRAFVKIMGALLPLSSDRARARVLDFIWDQLEEHKNATRKAS